jgi:hypothetical protein
VSEVYNFGFAKRVVFQLHNKKEAVSKVLNFKEAQNNIWSL